jgi:hypothetical protein
MPKVYISKVVAVIECSAVLSSGQNINHYGWWTTKMVSPINGSVYLILREYDCLLWLRLVLTCNQHFIRLGRIILSFTKDQTLSAQYHN